MVPGRYLVGSFYVPGPCKTKLHMILFIDTLTQSIKIVRMGRKTKLHMILLVDTRPHSIRIRVSRWSSSILLAQSIESAISILFAETRGTRDLYSVYSVKRWQRRFDSRLGHIFPLTVRCLNGTVPYHTVRYMYRYGTVRYGTVPVDKYHVKFELLLDK